MPKPTDLPRDIGDLANRAERNIGHVAELAERNIGHVAELAERNIGHVAELAERNIGQFIRDLRSNARISLRELADRAGVSNPYLSQIERGLRRPSADVLAQLAGALRVSTALMYLRAGLLPDNQGHSVLGAIAADPDLTTSQKQSLTQIYETFRRENARAGAEAEEQAVRPAELAAAATPRRVQREPAPVHGRTRTTASSGRGRATQKEADRS